MSDSPTPNPENTKAQGATEAADQPSADNLGASEGVTEESPEEAKTPQSIEQRLLGLGGAGRVLLETIQTLADVLDGPTHPQLVAGSIALLVDSSKDPSNIEYGCIASEFGNDLLLKGLAATMVEQRAAKSIESYRCQQAATMRDPILADLLATLKQRTSRSAPAAPFEPFAPHFGRIDVDSLCDDPACTPCAAAREAAGLPPLAAGPVGGADTGPEIAGPRED